MKFRAYRINGETFEQDKLPIKVSESYAEIQSELLNDGYSFKQKSVFINARGIYTKTIKIHNSFCECLTDDCDCMKSHTTIIIINESDK